MNNTLEEKETTQGVTTYMYGRIEAAHCRLSSEHASNTLSHGPWNQCSDNVTYSLRTINSLHLLAAMWSIEAIELIVVCCGLLLACLYDQW